MSSRHKRITLTIPTGLWHLLHSKHGRAAAPNWSATATQALEEALRPPDVKEELVRLRREVGLLKEKLAEADGRLECIIRIARGG